MIDYQSVYPPAFSATYIKATTELSGSYTAPPPCDPSNSLIGNDTNIGWIASAATNQRFHIDLGKAEVIKRIYYENRHVSGIYTDVGIKTFTVWGSNSSSSFAELTYGTNTGWTQITASQTTFDQHVAVDRADPKFIYIVNSTPYRYYAIKIADNWGHASYMGVRRIELQIEKSTNNTRTQTNWAKDPRCVLLIKGDGDNNGTVIRDSSPSAKTITVNGDTKTVTATKRYGNASIYFDGTGDYLSLADSDDFTYNGKIVTISCWLYWGTFSSATICGQYVDGTHNLLYYCTATSLRLVSTNGSNEIDAVATVSLVAGKWYHIVYTNDGTTQKLFLDGVQLTLTTNTNTSFTNFSAPLTIGYSSNGFSSNYYLDELAIWKGIAIPIEELYPQRKPLYDYALSEPAGV